MARDNNFTGHINLLGEPFPRVGRGDPTALGEPEFEAIIYGHADADFGAGFAAPIGSAALSTSGSFWLKTGATNGDWTRVPSLRDSQSIVALASTAISTPNNVLATAPQDFFAGEATLSLTAPYDGTFMAKIGGSFASNPLAGGTAFAQTMLARFTIDGVAAGAGRQLSGAGPTISVPQGFTGAQRLTLTAGEAVAVQWGWGGAQALAVATANAGRWFELTPVRA